MIWPDLQPGKYRFYSGDVLGLFIVTVTPEVVEAPWAAVTFCV
jgi:hypothetical protein